jgi:hypothetical protein
VNEELNEAIKVYSDKIIEVRDRLVACEDFLKLGEKECAAQRFYTEAAALQMRKALETLALSSIAPHKNAYQVAQKNPEIFKTHWHAQRILKAIENIHPDFYIQPANGFKGVTNQNRQLVRVGHPFTRGEFEDLYNFLGEFLHADNPWGNQKDYQNLTKRLEKSMPAIRKLIKMHFFPCRIPSFKGILIVEVPDNLFSNDCKVISCEAMPDENGSQDFLIS